ncbi:unnamed protein product [Ectocarpus sp. 12 AP-2014]
MPRLAMSTVRYATSIDIHPAAQISGEGVLIDHGASLVIGATAIIGARVILYHGVTLGNSGKKVSPGGKRHPTIGDRVVLGAGAKILGDITVEDDVLVGANSVVTKSVPKHHTAVGVPARILCHGTCTGKDVTGAAICELHRRLNRVEKGGDGVVGRPRREDADVAGGRQEDKTQQHSSNSSSRGRKLRRWLRRCLASRSFLRIGAKTTTAAAEDVRCACTLVVVIDIGERHRENFAQPEHPRGDCCELSQVRVMLPRRRRHALFVVVLVPRLRIPCGWRRGSWLIHVQ